jgi:phosphoenolpyruvate-protein phosphotransferase (PTS system enzyme I)
VTDHKERQFKGLGVSQGIAIGIAHVRESGVVDTPEYGLKKREVATEQERLKHAVNLAHRQVRRLQTRAKGMPGAASEELAILLDAYLHMLDDSRLIRGADRRIVEDRINAEAAVSREIAEIAEAFHAMEDSYIAARLDDIREVGNRILLSLGKHPARPMVALPKGSIIIAESLSPADMAQLDPTHIAGVATMLGGGEGHTAIMARALGLPGVLGAADLMDGVHSGDQVIVDGNSGRIIVNPIKERHTRFIRRRADFEKEIKQLAHLRKRRSISRDGTEISLQANVELPIEINAVKQAGAEKIGLLRSEFMFMNRATVPDENEQYEILRSIVEAMNGETVTIRSLDIGADKESHAVTGGMDDSATTALGLRGIRLSLAIPEMLETQFRAILRAANHGDVRVLLPMVSTVREVHKARAIMKSAASKLKRRKVKVPDVLPPIGVMVEVPGAALAADALAQVSDFLAIGSNDLTMYTLAVDRANEQVANLFDPLHPAVLRLIQFTVGAALRARIPVSICGEMAGDPRYTAILVGLGLRELSMTPSNIPKVKQRFRQMDAVAAATRANLIMDQVDAGRIMTLLDDFNALA